MHQALRADVISKGILAWMAFVTAMLFLFIHGNPNATFFRLGPHEDLILFGIPIHSAGRYAVVVAYTAVSTLVRTLQQEVLRPWVIQQVQNDHPKTPYVRSYAYFILGVETAYIWFDWLLYLNILLAQVDLMMVEMIGNLLATMYTTHLYLGQACAQPTANEPNDAYQLVSI